MITATQDTFHHPIDSVSLLSWMIQVWDHEPGLQLLIITNSGDGADLDNRLRVKLSKVRRSLKTGGVKDVKLFGFKSQVIPWTDDNGNNFDALCLTRFVTDTHKFAMIFNKMDL